MGELVEERLSSVVKIVQLVFLKSTLTSAVSDSIAQAAAVEKPIAEVDQRVSIATVICGIG